MSENILYDNDNIFTAEDLSVGYEKTHKGRMTDLKRSLTGCSAAAVVSVIHIKIDRGKTV